MKGTHLAACCPLPVTIGKWVQPACSAAVQQLKPSLTTLLPAANSRLASTSISLPPKPLTTARRRRPWLALGRRLDRGHVPRRAGCTAPALAARGIHRRDSRRRPPTRPASLDFGASRASIALPSACARAARPAVQAAASRPGSSTAKASRRPRREARAASMPAIWSTGASGLCSPTLGACRCGWSSTPPTAKTAPGWSWSAPTSVAAFLGSGICSPMPATRATSPGAPPRASAYSSRSSSANRASPTPYPPPPRRSVLIQPPPAWLGPAQILAKQRASVADNQEGFEHVPNSLSAASPSGRPSHRASWTSELRASASRLAFGEGTLVS